MALPFWRQPVWCNLGKALAQVACVCRVKQFRLVLVCSGSCGPEVVVMLDQHL